MKALVSTLETLERETGDGTMHEKKNAARGRDEFKSLKGHIAMAVKDIRAELKKREELIQKGASGTKANVQMSHEIRQKIKMAREDANKLMALQRKEDAKKKSKAPASGMTAEERQEIVELCFKHIEECELLEKRRFTSKNSEARVELFRGGAGPSGVTASRAMIGTELPDIETQDGLRQLQQKDQQIDQALEQVAEGVQELRGIAIDMRDEVKVQTSMVDEITHKVDAANQHLNNLNRRMKTTLASTRSADRFILDFILVVILLGIVGYIVSLVL